MYYGVFIKYMILDKEITIKVNPAQLKHFKSIGLKVKSGDIINIKPEQLNPGSNIKITCVCDVCGVKKENTYRRYKKSFDNGGYYSCSLKCSKNKIKNTFIEKYGEEHHFKTEKTKKKIKKTWLKKYGEEHFSHSDEYRSKVGLIQKKRKDTLNNKYIKKEGIISITDTGFVKYCKKHHGEYEIDKRLYHNRKGLNINTCTICYPIDENNSIKEKELYEFVKNNSNHLVEKNYRVYGKEIDVFIPELNLGFEFNGLYWHSEKYKHNTYHLEKTKVFESEGIRLVQIYEDDWVNKNNIVKSRVLNLLGKSKKLYARKCEIKELTTNNYRKFVSENHIQGYVGSSVKLGLFYENELVSVMSFGKLRKSLGNKHKEGSWELLRFCNKLNTTVVGGASKLFKHFIKNFEVSDIISYADRSWSSGDLYYNLGFCLSHETKPNYYYIIDRVRVNRYNFRKDKLISEGYDPNKTERQIMLDRGIYRIYDSGSLVFKFRNQS